MSRKEAKKCLLSVKIVCVFTLCVDHELIWENLELHRSYTGFVVVVCLFEEEHFLINMA